MSKDREEFAKVLEMFGIECFSLEDHGGINELDRYKDLVELYDKQAKEVATIKRAMVKETEDMKAMLDDLEKRRRYWYNKYNLLKEKRSAGTRAGEE